VNRNLRSAILIVWSVLVMMTAGASAAPDELKGPVRVFHFVLRGVALDDARRMAKEARAAGFNAVQVVLTDGVRLDRAPWKPLPDAWTKAQFITWVSELRAEGLEFIPELKLLTHQEKFFQNEHKELTFNRSTYDPRKEGTYERVFDLLDEVIAIIRPKAVHIGHDEVAGHNAASKEKWLGPGEQMLPADLFLKDVLRIHGYLKQRSIATWIWGDMLISPTEFAGMAPQHLHGSAPGYGKALRDRLPKGIVICDWHYLDEQPAFPSFSTIQEEGFRVIGTTWKKERTIRNFSGYAALHGGYGMMATTWFHVQRKEWSVVDRIISASGAAFLKDFPDAD
jgi:hypothetical protein